MGVRQRHRRVQGVTILPVPSAKNIGALNVAGSLEKFIPAKCTTICGEDHGGIGIRELVYE